MTAEHYRVEGRLVARPLHEHTIATARVGDVEYDIDWPTDDETGVRDPWLAEIYDARGVLVAHINPWPETSGPGWRGSRQVVEACASWLRTYRHDGDGPAEWEWVTCS